MKAEEIYIVMDYHSNQVESVYYNKEDAEKEVKEAKKQNHRIPFDVYSYPIEGKSKLQALKEGLQHDEFELDNAAEEYATEASKKYKTASVFKDGALWMLHYIKTNLEDK